jgi:hypothetical protein
VIAPTLVEGVSHVKNCLDIDVPFGTRHDYMGTHNHRLQLGNSVYLEIVALDPQGTEPERSRWFGLDNQKSIRSDWDKGRRFRGWVASTVDISAKIAAHRNVFGEKVPLPPANPTFDFSIPVNGSLPLDGAAPSLIDHRDDPTSMTDIPNLGAQLVSFSLEHPDPAAIEMLYRDLPIDRPPKLVLGPNIRFQAQIETPTGLKELT